MIMIFTFITTTIIIIITIIIRNLPKHASLPVASVQLTKHKILSSSPLNSEWNHFKYIYFTESDQILGVCM